MSKFAQLAHKIKIRTRIIRWELRYNGLFFF